MKFPLTLTITSETATPKSIRVQCHSIDHHLQVKQFLGFWKSWNFWEKTKQISWGISEIVESDEWGICD